MAMKREKAQTDGTNVVQGVSAAEKGAGGEECEEVADPADNAELEEKNVQEAEKALREAKERLSNEEDALKDLSKIEFSVEVKKVEEVDS